jgi:hypothetical protein
MEFDDGVPATLVYNGYGFRRSSFRSRRLSFWHALQCLSPESREGEKTFSHHAFPTANKLCHPLEVLTGRETEFYLNVMKKLKSVIAEALEAVTGCLYEIIYVALMNPRCCSRAPALQSVRS